MLQRTCSDSTLQQEAANKSEICIVVRQMKWTMIDLHLLILLEFDSLMYLLILFCINTFIVDNTI